MTPATPPEIAATAKEHLEKLTQGTDLIAARQVHPASPEGKIFTIILEALQFVIGILHHSSTETPAAIANTTETEKA